MCDKKTKRKRPKKITGPFGDRKIGERSAKGVTPPFHPKGADHRKYKSNW